MREASTAIGREKNTTAKRNWICVSMKSSRVIVPSASPTRYGFSIARTLPFNAATCSLKSPIVSSLQNGTKRHNHIRDAPSGRLIQTERRRPAQIVAVLMCT